MKGTVCLLIFLLLPSVSITKPLNYFLMFLLIVFLPF